MTLIDSEQLHAIVNSFGTALFAITMLCTLWFATKMD